jgi:hypothetical protein
VTAAGAALQARAAAALRTLAGLAVHEWRPLKAAGPWALVEAGPERDWGHKSGAGREVRLSATLFDQGERPARLHALAAAAEAALAGIEGEADGWQLVSLCFLRSRIVPPRAPGPDAVTSLVMEYRARMLAA